MGMAPLNQGLVSCTMHALAGVSHRATKDNRGKVFVSFFKKYNGSIHVGLVRLETLIWVLIYGGLLAVVLASFVENASLDVTQSLYWGGGGAIALGVGLIYLRSRLRDEA
jgi:hypothetical protein